MTQEPERNAETTRRGMLAGVGIAGLAGTLAACKLGGASASSPTGSSSAGSPDSGSSAGGSAAAGGTGSVLARTSEIHVGGGKVFAAEKVVVTQPKAGKFKAFSAICTHMGCVVDQVASGTIDCPCHGSQFSITDGRVVAGPAPSPLPKRHIKVKHGKIRLIDM